MGYVSNVTGTRHSFSSREELIGYLKNAFSEAAPLSEERKKPAEPRQVAKPLIDRIGPVQTGKSRKFLDGRVTKLSPYLRNGVVGLDEVRGAALRKVQKSENAKKQVKDFAWRDYYQRLYEKLGVGVWEDIEPYKTGFTARQYSSKMPIDIVKADTGTCMDQFIDELYKTGYLHNHARMWLASYIIHWRKVRWQTGATWFLMHLLDGDPASNNLSWQWVASTYSHKPYIFNLDNLAKYGVPVAGTDSSPFEGTYAEISERLFPNLQEGV